MGDEGSARVLAERMADGLRDIFDASLVAVVLHGSLTIGGFVSGRSDVDLLVVVEQPLSDQDVTAARELGARLIADQDPPVDLRIVTRASAAHPSRTPELELYLRRSPSGEEDVDVKTAEPDLLVEFELARAHGVPLVGAEPSTFIGAVPHTWITDLGDEVVAAWQQLTDDTAHAELMVLTSCRIWRFAVDGTFVSKSEAGRWALTREPSLYAVEGALRTRAGEHDVRVEPAEIGRVLARVREELR